MRLEACGEGIVCIPMDDLLALATYLGGVAEVQESMTKCPYVVYRD